MLNTYKKSLSTTIFLSAAFAIFSTHCMRVDDLAAQAKMLLERHYKASEDYHCEQAPDSLGGLPQFPTSAFLPGDSMEVPSQAQIELATNIMYKPFDRHHFDSYITSPTGKFVPFVAYTTADVFILFRCKRCRYGSTSPKTAIEHGQIRHPNQNPTMELCSTGEPLTWYCKLCRGTFDTDTFSQHLIAHR